MEGRRSLWAEVWGSRQYILTAILKIPLEVDRQPWEASERDRQPGVGSVFREGRPVPAGV